MRNVLAEFVCTKKPKFGHYVGEFATPGIGHLLASAGCDFVFFDMEHSGFGFETLKQVIRYFEAANISLIARTPTKDYDGIARLCDAGAEGIMAPMVSSADEAAKIVSYMKYPPVGKKGLALGAAHDNFSLGTVSVEKRLNEANDRTTFFAMIETSEGINNVEEIASTPGVDCLWIGHFDLSASLGIPGQFEHPTYLEAVTHICETAKKDNRSLGQLINSIPEGKTVLAKEYDFVCYGTDTSIYQRALLEGISELRCAVKN